MRVLIVDDEPTIREFFTQMARNRECDTAYSVDSAEAALSTVLRQSYNLITLDILMPGLCGLEIIAVLRNMNPHAVIAVISGFIPEQIPEEGRKLHRRTAAQTDQCRNLLRAHRHSEPDVPDAGAASDAGRVHGNRGLLTLTHALMPSPPGRQITLGLEVVRYPDRGRGCDAIIHVDEDVVRWLGRLGDLCRRG